MNKFTAEIFSLAIIWVCLSMVTCSQQPSYQVSIFIQLPSGYPRFHLCNGAIIQTRLILTTASCLYYKFGPNKPLSVIKASMLSVVAGTAYAFDGAILLNVSEIEMLRGFNPETLKNDIAILRLSSSLDLGIRDDMKWIILDDNEYKEYPCKANFQARNSLYNVSSDVQTKQIRILPIEECYKESKYPNVRSRDICSYFIRPLDNGCNENNTLNEFNGNRGTGLVCNSRLVAVLSSILPLSKNSTTDCSKLDLKAFYTNLGPHLDWIYEIITIEELVDVNKSNYIASQPYQDQSGNITEFYQPVVSETAVMSTFITDEYLDGYIPETSTSCPIEHEMQFNQGSAQTKSSILATIFVLFLVKFCQVYTYLH